MRVTEHAAGVLFSGDSQRPKTVVYDGEAGVYLAMRHGTGEDRLALAPHSLPRVNAYTLTSRRGEVRAAVPARALLQAVRDGTAEMGLRWTEPHTYRFQRPLSRLVAEEELPGRRRMTSAAAVKSGATPAHDAPRTGNPPQSPTS